MNELEMSLGSTSNGPQEGPSPPPRMSVVLATYNRLHLLKRLLDGLAKQTLSPSEFEVIVVDDGSAVPVRPQLDASRYPFRLTVAEQLNAGPSAARHRGVLHARGEILVSLDDDMELPPRFLEAHLAHHASGRPTAVFGRYVSDPGIGKKPIFERYHGLKWDQLSSANARGKLRVDGTLLATGNASMRREDYLRVGGLESLVAARRGHGPWSRAGGDRGRARLLGDRVLRSSFGPYATREMAGAGVHPWQAGAFDCAKAPVDGARGPLALCLFAPTRRTHLLCAERGRPRRR